MIRLICTFLCVFVLISCKESSKLDHEKINGSLVVSIHNIPVLGYQFETLYPPEGIDSLFKRSGFIHPLSTTSGEVLTRIQPDDHYHHYGVWNPWTQVLYKEDTIDFWNLYFGQGTVRFAGFEKIESSDSQVRFQVLHEHVSMKSGIEEVALNEYQTYEISLLSDSSYIVDMTFDYQCATENQFTILEYRYAGLGWRATEYWNQENSEIITSEGNTRLDADGTTAQWCIVQGELQNDYGGVVMMSNPNNFNHPEPLRIWPNNLQGDGEVFANFAPTKDRNWEMIPGNTYTLKYRFIVNDHKVSPKEAESFWKDYLRTSQE